ncbi:MAG: hypothetical protein KDB88_00720 [Flavobacteriales bacterium]|nr:hypothetical protein [Flavobacteriales bacterium]
MRINDFRAVGLVMLLAACGGAPEAEVDRQDSPQEDPEAVGIDLSAEGFPLVVHPPEGLDDPLEVTWVEEFGHLEVTAGDRFALIITEGLADIQRLKADLDRDLLRTHTVLREDADHVVYKSAFPDDPDLVFVHFYQVIDAGGSTFVVESRPEGRFDQADVDAMAQAVKAKEPA